MYQSIEVWIMIVFMNYVDKKLQKLQNEIHKIIEQHEAEGNSGINYYNNCSFYNRTHYFLFLT
jgi:hypothetical protein